MSDSFSSQFRFLILIFLVVNSLYSESAPVHELIDADTYRLGSEVEYLFDVGQTLKLDEVKASDAWTNIQSDNINFGFRSEALWLRFSIKPAYTADYIVHIPYPLLDYLDNYSFLNSRELPAILTGDSRKFNTRKNNYIDFVFPYSLNKGDVLTVYLRVKTNGSFDIPIDFLRSDVFFEKERSNNFFRGFVSGILWLMLFYNVFIYVAIKDRVYLFYVIHIFSCMVTSYAYDGAAFQYVWPNTPALNDFIFPIFNGLIQATSILFMLELLQIRKRQTWYSRYFLGLLFVVSFFPILGAILPYSTIVPVEVVFSLLVNTSALIVGLHLSFKGDKSAQYFTVAVALFMVGLVSSNLKSLGLLPNNFFTQHAYQLGFFIEMVVLSLALAQKIDTAKKKLIYVQNESIVNLNRYKELYSESVSGNFQVHLSGKIMSVNRAFCEILGYSSIEQLMASDASNNITDISVDPLVPKKLMGVIRDKGELIDFEDKVKHQTGKTIWVSLSMRQVRNSEDKIEYLEGSMLDISGRKESEYLKEQATKDKMNSLEQLVVGICHELNTPLGIAITSLSHINELIKDLSNSYEDKKLTHAIFKEIILDEIKSIEFTEESLVRIRSLLKKFKHISVNQIDYKSSTDYLLSTLESGIDKNTKEINEADVKVAIECSANLQVLSYHEALAEVINQLVNNSIDHGFKGNEKNSINIHAFENKGFIHIKYQDNGSGLSHKGKEGLFNPFYTTMRGSQGKIGLGMYLTYNIITQLLHGDIEINSTSTGLCLTISFPIVVL